MANTDFYQKALLLGQGVKDQEQQKALEVEPGLILEQDLDDQVDEKALAITKTMKSSKKMIQKKI